MTSKRVLCFIDSLGPGGAQRQMVGLACILKGMGYDVIVCTYHDIQFYLNELETNNIHYTYLERAESSLMRIWSVIVFFRKMAPDVVISYLETPSICSCIAKLFNKQIKLIVSERNTTQFTGWKERIRFLLFRVADYIVPNSFSQGDYIRTQFPELKDKVRTIPNFVDLNLFSPLATKKRNQIPIVLVVASIWPSKNTLGFLDAISLLKKSGHRIKVIWYGKDQSNIDYYNQCQSKIISLGIQDFVSLKEKSRQIHLVYQNADFFCLPSFYEGTPNVICEAMACGLPIACSDVCDNSRYVISGENGYLFDPDSVGSIYQAISRIVSLSDEEYHLFSLRSRERAELYFAKDSFAQSYIKLIENEN